MTQDTGLLGIRRWACVFVKGAENPRWLAGRPSVWLDPWLLICFREAGVGAGGGASCLSQTSFLHLLSLSTWQR